MSIKYKLYYDELMKHKDAINRENPIDLEVMYADVKEWKPTRSLVSTEPVEGWDEAVLVGPFGNSVEGEKVFLKVVEELSPEDED